MCTSPLVRFRVKRGITTDTILGSSSSFCIKSQRFLEEIFGSFSAFRDYFDRNMDYQFIKCRKCSECRMQYASEWSVRCSHEFIMQKKACFLTLTIDDTKAYLFNTKKNMQHYCKRCVKGNRYIKYPINYTLSKGFILDELKRIRDVLYKRYGIFVRYFGCGEYGSNNERPHYHLLLFGYDFPDKQPVQLSKKGVQIYHSAELQDLWQYGLSTVQEINHRACMYTAKYCLKKLRFSDDIQAQEFYYGREQEFLFMSKGSCNAKRCPFIDDIIKNCKGMKSLRSLSNPYCKNCKYSRGGIGYSWFQHYYLDILKIGYVTIDNIKYPIPKYYIDMLKLTDLDLYDKYKINILKKIDESVEKDISQSKLDVRNKIIKSKLKTSSRE